MQATAMAGSIPRRRCWICTRSIANGRWIGLSVAFIGEFDKGRTARSLAYLLAKFERVKIFFVSPAELQMKPDILEYLDDHGVQYELESDIDRVIGEVDVVYQTRIRPERVRTGRTAAVRHQFGSPAGR